MNCVNNSIVIKIPNVKYRIKLFCLNIYNTNKFVIKKTNSKGYKIVVTFNDYLTSTNIIVSNDFLYFLKYKQNNVLLISFYVFRL